MLDVFNFANPQTANYQEFYGGGTTRDWMKPRGASMVRMLLISAGAGGRVGSTFSGGIGGGSGSVTTWIGPAIFIPDQLQIVIGAGGASGAAGGNTSVIWQPGDWLCHWPARDMSLRIERARFLLDQVVK